MADVQDSKMAHKIAAYEEVKNELKKQIDTLSKQTLLKKGIAVGFKVSIENIYTQMKNFQKMVDDEKNKIELATAKMVIVQMQACADILTKNGRQQELEEASLRGQIQSMENQIKTTDLFIKKQTQKTAKGSNSKYAKIDQARKRRQAKIAQDAEKEEAKEAKEEPKTKTKSKKAKE